MSTTIHIRGISKMADLKQLQRMFERIGMVENVTTDSEGSASGSISVYIQMVHSADAQKALTTMNGKDFEGRRLSIKQASLRRDR